MRVTFWALSTVRLTRLGLDLPASALVGDEDATFAGGSYVVVQKYLHDPHCVGADSNAPPRKDHWSYER